VGTSLVTIKVVAGLIFREGRVLACQRRRDGAFPLKWEFPGGKIEQGESAVEALGRELREELAIDVLESAEVYEREHLYPGGPAVHLKFFEVLRYNGEVENRAFQQIAWVELANLAKLDFLDGDKPLIDKLAGGRR
jgi:8-oxo-dGTP diphosphatase